MKIELLYNQEGHRVGFQLIREDTDDIAVVEQVRDMYFWNIDDEVLQYAGRKSNDNDETIQLSFVTKAEKQRIRKLINS